MPPKLPPPPEGLELPRHLRVFRVSEVARALNTSRAYVYMILAGQRTPGPALVEGIAALLHEKPAAVRRMIEADRRVIDHKHKEMTT
jgi:transcriptional regulator with XRE-family HTH domain